MSSYILASIPGIKGYFEQYLKTGYYPFDQQDELSFYEKLSNTAEKTIYEDIASFYSLKTENLYYLKQLVMFLSSIPPGTINIHKIAHQLKLDDKTVLNYLHYLKDTGLVRLLYPNAKGHAALRRPQKILLDNTNLYYTFQGNLTSQIELGTTRELFFVQSLLDAGHTVFSAQRGDYYVDGYTFEIGGRNKTPHQIKETQRAFLVKDDQLIAQAGEIPLMVWGFLY